MVVPVISVIFPQLIVPVIILLVDDNVGCLPFIFVSIVSIFVPTLVDPYNKLVEAVIVGAVMVVPVIPVIFPQLIVPVIILLVDDNVGCFSSN